nr:MAG TPA: hypothetical protein [Caudoviricetes sp.]
MILNTENAKRKIPVQWTRIIIWCLGSAPLMGIKLIIYIHFGAVLVQCINCL